MKRNKYNIKIYKWNFRKHKWKIKGNKYEIKGNKLKYTEMDGRNQIYNINLFILYNPFTRNWIQEIIIKYNTRLHIQIFIYIHHCQQYFLYIFLMVIFINKTNTEGTLRFCPMKLTAGIIYRIFFVDYRFLLSCRRWTKNKRMRMLNKKK